MPTLSMADAGQTGFTAGLVSSFSMIMVSEIGDKTFLIAAIMSMTHGRWQVFLGAIAALAAMTVLSTAFGLLFPHLLSKNLTSWVAAALFAVFGFKMVRDGWKMADSQLQEEYAQVQMELESKEPSVSPVTVKANAMEAQGNGTSLGLLHKSALFWKVATLTFLAEWGDRSQIATIALAAAQDAVGVTIGAIIGHAVCTLMAVMFGHLLARWVSIRTVTMSGGALFVLFSVLTVLGVM